MKITNCPICDNNSFIKFIEFNNFPEFLFPIPKTFLNHITGVDFKLSYCQKCGHIMQTDIDDKIIKKIYTELYQFYNLSTSEQMASVYRSRFLEFFNKCAKKVSNNKLLEIGCGEAARCLDYGRQGFDYYGIDPSNNIDKAIKKYPQAHFKKSDFTKNPFDFKFGMIISQFSLEHTTDVNCFFRDVVSYAEKGTLLIVEVPDARYYIKNKLPFFYAYEHISYFDVEGLKTLFEKFGFEVLDANFEDNPSILICGRYVGRDIIKVKDRAESFRRNIIIEKRYLENLGFIEEKVRKKLANCHGICFYGAGLIYYWLRLKCIDKSKKLVIFDDNDYYHNKFTPYFKDKVIIPDQESISNFDVIFLSVNPPYYHKVKERIKELHKSNCKLIYLSDGELITETLSKI